MLLINVVVVVYRRQRSTGEGCTLNDRVSSSVCVVYVQEGWTPPTSPVPLPRYQLLLVWCLRNTLSVYTHSTYAFVVVVLVIVFVVTVLVILAVQHRCRRKGMCRSSLGKKHHGQLPCRRWIRVISSSPSSSSSSSSTAATIF